jgi:hypothetical protein
MRKRRRSFSGGMDPTFREALLFQLHFSILLRKA